MSELLLAVETDGSIRSIYSDELVGIFGESARMTVKRASHVEPGPDGGWLVDLSPVGGGVHGPFKYRFEALAFEVGWLNATLFT